MTTQKALFLDRDGVINKEKHYCHKIEEFEFLPGVFDLTKAFQERHYRIVVITNQAGIGRGIYTEEDFQHLTKWMIQQFSLRSITIDAVYHCPHHPTHGIGKYKTTCLCRKPAPGMIKQAQSAFNIDLAQSVLIGDKVSDIQAGKNAGIGHNYLVTTGHQLAATDKEQADKVFSGLIELKDYLLEHTNE
ncbi:D-glycero-beta-D-manno-heptose 1,7-bisphosphate 7-phosphatase [Alteromonas gilva]|uniref:D,D-heptose 1,7-bisphosphate phosphatase n=1 Tax=Alteromonas gilva TaxID=2987522 RepID=A0ABT5KZY8_9ALTE|nr:D-glycero-beta-D-manno-heptose 1,7-bisphosphate 7-phosphatase [Alteromonas gilva]MDC8830344.1 D-glycero-beta-D-manno-heptose 1,7-bisphosphate 7-phosphatase [Alteromonas gilva]